MFKAAVLGHPVHHSLSPAIFGFLGARLGRSDVAYEALDVAPEHLAEFLKVARTEENRAGFNITIPHKETTLRLMDELTPEARAIGAVNVVQKSGRRWIGHNTDVEGVRGSLRDQGVVLKGQSALILGAGGAARAAAFALGLESASRVVLWNRTPARAETLALEMSRHFPATTFEVARSMDTLDVSQFVLCVQSTPVGMQGYVSGSATESAAVYGRLWARSWKPNAVAFDLIYRPEQTPFLKTAAAHGLTPLSGLSMLVHQALATWEIWFGPLSEKTLLARDLLQHLRVVLAGTESKGPIFLCGFMGVGKSTVGRHLADRLCCPYLDTDELIEAKAGRGIPQIFQELGEAAFRQLERDVLATLPSGPAVVSLGGGALQDVAHLAKIKSQGRLVYLSASVDSLLLRLSPVAFSRPLLAGVPAAERPLRIRALLEDRLPLYRQADFEIATDGRSAEEVAAEVARRIQGGSR